MKKIIFLAIALMMSLGAWAQVSYTEVQNSAKDGWQISLASYYRSTYAYINGNNLSVSASKGDFRFTLQWVDASNGFRLYDPTTEKYVGKTPASASNAIPSTTDEDQAGIYEFQEATPDCTPGTGGLGFAQNTTACVYMKCLNANNTSFPAWHLSGGQTGNVINWDGNKSGGGNAWVVMALEDPTSGPTTEQISELQTKINVALGKGSGVGYPKADAAERFALNAYDSYLYDGVTAETYNDALEKYNAFLACTTVVLPTAGKYYQLKAVYYTGGEQYLYNDGTQLAVATAEPANGATFYVESVEDNTIVLKNGNKYLQWTSGDDDSKSSNLTGFADSKTDLANLTFLKSNSTPGANGRTNKATAENIFGLLSIQGKGSNGSTYYFTTRDDNGTTGRFIAANPGDKFFDANYNDNNQNRTSFYKLVEVDAPAAINWAGLQNKVDEAKAYPVGDGLGKYTYMLMGQPMNDYWIFTYYETALTNRTATAEEVEGYINTIQSMIDALTLNMPEAGQLLRMRGVVNTGKYLQDTSNSQNKYVMATEQGASSIFYFDGNHLLNYNTGLYTGVDGGTWAWAAVGAEGTQVTFHDASTAGAYRIQVPKGTGKKDYVFLYSGDVNASAADRGGFDNVAACTDTKYQWILEEVTTLPVTFKEAGQGYATIYSPVALEIPTGVVAYYGTEESEGAVKVSAIEDGIIPANTAVVLFKEGVTETTTVDFTISGEAGTATSCFTGTVPAIATVENSYVFSIAGATPAPGFYSFEGASLAGFKAYYVSAGASVNGFVLDFGGQTVGIEGLQTAAPVKGAFDLQGRRVNAATRGLFIQNGVKVIK